MPGRAPLQVAFSATGSGGLAPYTYSWAFGDATSGSGGSASHSYGTGTYYPTVTMHDAAGGTWTASVARISALAPPSSGGGGSNGTGAPASSGNPTGPTSAPTAAPTEAPAPSPSASPESSPTPSTAGSSPSRPAATISRISSNRFRVRRATSSRKRASRSGLPIRDI